MNRIRNGRVLVPTYSEDEYQVTGVNTFKAIILGKASIGKTALIRRFVDHQFRDYENTVGIAACIGGYILVVFIYLVDY